jgi:membrane-associated phospholipid phosphatase
MTTVTIALSIGQSVPAMPSWAESVLNWGLDMVVRVQNTAAASGLERVLDPLFRAISALGDGFFFLALLPFLFWCVDKRRAARLTILFMISTYLNFLLKDLFAIPRPFMLSDAVQAKQIVSGYAFPSGHAQIVAAIWPALALTFRRPWLSAIAIPLLILIPFSRIYLGVHYPQDAIAGMVIGLVLMVAYFRLGPRIEAWLGNQNDRARIGIFALFALIIAVTLPIPEGMALAGGVLGLCIGYVLELAGNDFRHYRRWHYHGLRMAVGLLICLAAYLAVMAPSPPASPPGGPGVLRIVQYAALGIAPTFIVPAALVRLGLARAAAHWNPTRHPH